MSGTIIGYNKEIMMVKTANTLHRVVMMAVAFIMTLTTNVANGGPLDWAQRQLQGASDTADKAIDAAVALRKIADFAAHKDAFVDSFGLKDLFGRSDEASWFIGCAFFGLLLMSVFNTFRRAKKAEEAVKKAKEKGDEKALKRAEKKAKEMAKAVTPTGFIAKAIGLYLLAAGVGFAYELIRTSFQYNETCEFALNSTYFLMGLGALLNTPKVWGILKAAKAKGPRNFLRGVIFEGSGSKTPKSTTPEKTPRLPTKPTDVQPTPVTVPSPQPRVVEPPKVKKPSGPPCPNPKCGEPTKPGANFCGICLTPLGKKEVMVEKPPEPTRKNVRKRTSAKKPWKHKY